MGFEENTFCKRFLWHWKMLQADPVDGVFSKKRSDFSTGDLFIFINLNNTVCLKSPSLCEIFFRQLLKRR